MPAEGQMDAILFTQLCAAALVQCIELHDAPGQFGVVLGLNFEAKTRASDPGNAAETSGFKTLNFAGLEVAPFAEDVANRTRYAAPDNASGDHSSKTWAIAFLTASIA